MIYYLVTRANRNTINRFRQSWGRELADRITPFPYEDVFKTRRLPAGAYVFSDLERLAPAEAERAAAVWQALADAGTTPLNHPLRSMRRYELLRTLHERGINAFDVYRATEARTPARFPVFVRGENDHDGSGTPLLESPAALADAIARLEARGVSRERLLIEEFCDTADAAGWYRKYSVFAFRGRVVPRHVFFSRAWMLKTPEVVGQDLVDEEHAYVRANPDEAQLREIFALARIDYGRIDYAFLNGRIQVWEINTNPQIMSFQDGGGPARLPTHERVAANVKAAFRAIDVDAHGEIAVDAADRFLTRSARTAVVETYHWTLRSLGLLNRESSIMASLKSWARRAGVAP